MLPAKRECGDGGEEPGHPGHAIHTGTLGLGTMPPFTFQLPDQPGPPPEPVIQNLANMSISGITHLFTEHVMTNCFQEVEAWPISHQVKDLRRNHLGRLMGRELRSLSCKLLFNSIRSNLHSFNNCNSSTSNSSNKSCSRDN